MRVLLSAIQRTTAIAWNPDIDKALDAVCEKAGKLRGKPKYSQEIITMFDKETVQVSRMAYCETRMVNKYLLPLPIDCVLNKLGNNTGNLSVLADMIGMMDMTSHILKASPSNKSKRFVHASIKHATLQY